MRKNPRPPSAPIILASRSPRRIELIKTLIKNFEVTPSDVEEHLQPDRSPAENAVAIARDKAAWVAARKPGHWVIGADTIVVQEGTIIGKPADEDDARKILRRLSGREHQVITGVALIASETFEAATVSHVKFKSVTDEEIDRYIATGEPMDKAGAYAIQGEGSFLVDSYRGSYSNIVGLPMETVKALLDQSGYPFD